MTLSASLQRCRGQGFPPWLPAEPKRRSQAGARTLIAPPRSRERSRRSRPDRALISYRFRRRCNKIGASGGAPARKTFLMLSSSSSSNCTRDMKWSRHGSSAYTRDHSFCRARCSLSVHYHRDNKSHSALSFFDILGIHITSNLHYNVFIKEITATIKRPPGREIMYDLGAKMDVFLRCSAIKMFKWWTIPCIGFEAEFRNNNSHY